MGRIQPTYIEVMIHLLSTTSQHEMGKTRFSTFLSISCFQSSTLPETKSNHPFSKAKMYENVSFGEGIFLATWGE